jgi:predicted RNA-binding protein with PUA-like domain
MAYWLLKSEPSDFNWTAQAALGAKGGPWTGVRNAQARIHMRAIRKGDLAFFYHTGAQKAVVGVVRAAREAYPDPAPDGEGWVVVDVAAVEAVPKPVAISAIRAEPKLKDMVLVRNSRLSVQPVTPAEWALVRKMGGL